MSREQLAALENDEWWIEDLIGLEAYTTAGSAIGIVVNIIDGCNQLLEIKGPQTADGKSILVPFVKALVPRVDLSRKRVEIVDLPGLLEAQ